MSAVNSSIQDYNKIPIPKKGVFKTLLAYVGPGFMVAVGYMDPGNWATDIAGGSQFGYTLLSVILLSSICAMILQFLSLKLGIATDQDLAKACKEHYSPKYTFMLWILCELAIIACDIAEVVGAAIALKLLFSIPLIVGVIITVLDTLIILFLTNKNFRLLEIIIAVLVFTIASCFIANMYLAKPEIEPLLKGFLPSHEIFSNPDMLFIAVGILGATVMPHNLYLHSGIIHTRGYDSSFESKKKAIKYAGIDSSVSLFFAFFINASILILAASIFHKNNMHVETIDKAYELISPLTGASFASILFAVALLASGQNSTITGTLAGQITMEGFLSITLKPWLRRLITRLLAILPVVFCILIFGNQSTDFLLLLSQVVLSLQLPFAIVPLVKFTNSEKKMGVFKNTFILKWTAYFIVTLIICLNLFLVVESII